MISGRDMFWGSSAMDYFDKRDNVSLCEDVAGIGSNQFVNAGSDIQKFYENKNVFVTDANGLGGLLVEKLLRSCPKIGTIYLLINIKKNKLHEERCEEFFFSEVSAKINLKHKYLKKKIKIVYGDYTQPFCGISELDQKILNDGIQIMFHCTGTANKYENLKSLYYNNIQSTKSLLELASKMKNIKAFIYVSTVNAINFQQDVQEKLHERMFSYNLKSWEEQLQAVTPKITERRGDLNDFTKAVAEDIVKKYNGKLPIAIARSSYGFYQNNIFSTKKLFNIPTETFSTFISALKYYAYETKNNAISADNFVNKIVAISWQVGKNKSNRNDFNIPVYDLVPSWNPKIPTNCGEHFTEDTDLIYLAISKQISEFDKPEHENNHNWMYYQKKYLYPVMFLLILNLYLKIYSNTHKILNTFVKTDDSILSSGYNHQEVWSNYQSNVDKLRSSMSNVDKKLFNFDIINNEWKYCNSRNIRNMIAYIFKDDLNDLEGTSSNFDRYKQIKMYLKKLRRGVVAYLIVTRYFLVLLQALNRVFL